MDEHERLVAAHAAMRTRHGRRFMVVVPSRAIERWHEPPSETQAYEERLLCLLLMLRDPGLRVVYVTSSPVPPAIVGYYLSLLPPAVRRDAAARLTLVSPRDRSRRPLTEKLLERPRLLTQIRWAARERELGYLLPYMTTALERDLALALDMPIYGADRRECGTKSGGRELFARAGVPHPLGVEHVVGARGAVVAIARLRAAKPELAEVVVKLDDAVSGEGNAIADLRALPRPGAGDERERIAERLERLAVEAAGVSVDAYLAQLARRGGVVEERIVGRDVRSPSVQMEITPTGGVEIVSTHDQLLSGQSYLGCRFPAAPAYAAAISASAVKIGRRLAAVGALGRCAVDFVVADGRPYAIEINVRAGGTTHPFAALSLLTGGRYDPEAATFTTPTGAEKHYVATDDLEAPSLRALGCDGVLTQRRVGFDRARRCGVVFHMLSALGPLGRVGFTAIGDDAADAQRRYEQAQDVLFEAAAAPARAALSDYQMSVGR